MNTKICKKCGKEKPINQFYKHSEMSDGRLNVCKNCKQEYSKKYREKNIKKIREHDRNRANSTERQAKQKAKIKENEDIRKKYSVAKLKWAKENREKRNAEQKVKRAIEKGILKRPDYCQHCGRKVELEAHHTNYKKPLEVVFLCSKCHKAEHKKTNEEKRTNE